MTGTGAEESLPMTGTIDGRAGATRTAPATAVRAFCAEPDGEEGRK